MTAVGELLPPMLTNPAWLMADVAAEVWAPPPPVDLEAWAVRNISFGKDSPFPGPYDAARFPYFHRVLEVLSPDHPCQVVSLMKSAQVGGTVLGNVFMGATIDLDPGPFMYAHPTEPNAVRWSRQKLKPFLRGAPSLAALFPSVSSREGGVSILYRERRDGLGFIQVVGASSPANLSQSSYPRQVQDDLAKWETNDGGDPEVQADSRSRAFADRKVFKISTPLVNPGCRITRAFKAGTQEYFHLPCPQCGHEAPLEWDSFRASIDPKKPEAAHFTCRECGGVIEERHRPWMLPRGRWVAQNPEAGARHCSFHVSAFYSPTERWADIARAWLAAQGDPAAEQTFYNDTLGLPYETAGEAPPYEELHRRAEAAGLPRGVVPRGALLLALTIDVQGDRVEWHLCGFGRRRQRWTIDYGVVGGSIASEETRDALKALVDREWPDWQGNRRKVDLGAVDGNAYTTDVYGWLRERKIPESRMMMVRGVHGTTAPIIERVKQERNARGERKKYQHRFFNVGVSGLKTALYQALAIDDPEKPGFVHFVAGLGIEFFKQLTSERRKRRRLANGGSDWIWHLAEGERNEALDTAVYAAAVAERLNWRFLDDGMWDRLEAEREAPPPAAELPLDEPTVAVLARQAQRRPQTDDAKERLRRMIRREG